MNAELLGTAESIEITFTRSNILYGRRAGYKRTELDSLGGCTLRFPGYVCIGTNLHHGHFFALSYVTLSFAAHDFATSMQILSLVTIDTDEANVSVIPMPTRMARFATFRVVTTPAMWDRKPATDESTGRQPPLCPIVTVGAPKTNPPIRIAIMSRFGCAT